MVIPIWKRGGIEVKILVVAAGKNTRFKGDKALAKINGMENIVNTYNKLNKYASEFIVAVRKEKINDYKKVLPQATFIPLRKSNGCGQGTMDALKKIKKDPFLLITWGDMYFKDTKFMKDIMHRYRMNRFNILVEFNAYPYTSYIVNRKMEPMNVFYSILHRKIPSLGYEDRGVFLGKKSFLMPYLKKLKKNKGEYRLLDIVHAMYSNKEPAKLILSKDVGIRTFNTRKDLEALTNERSQNT
ncbi:hypothetical protein LCGC14_2692590 [marine sediment metagenome]|uniref:MobA-like NTP transferase domain-containing protein n=1 Tax=marine sediment metagenome TaxID=412755 RepID=A0A0F8ZI40_9ZZZZ